MSVHVFFQRDDIEDVTYEKGVGKPYYVVRFSDQSRMFADVDALEAIVAQGKADQARQDAAVQP